MAIEQKFDFKKHWLSLDQAGPDAFALDAGTTAGYIAAHYCGRRKTPTKARMEKLFKACKQRGWLTSKNDLVQFFYS